MSCFGWFSLIGGLLICICSEVFYLGASHFLWNITCENSLRTGIKANFEFHWKRFTLVSVRCLGALKVWDYFWSYYWLQVLFSPLWRWCLIMWIQVENLHESRLVYTNSQGRLSTQFDQHQDPKKAVFSQMDEFISRWPLHWECCPAESQLWRGLLLDFRVGTRFYPLSSSSWDNTKTNAQMHLVLESKPGFRALHTSLGPYFHAWVFLSFCSAHILFYPTF